MHYPRYNLFCDEVDTDDEIDAIFNKLQQIEPPEWLIQRILTSVSQLSQAEQPAIPSQPDFAGFESDGLIVHNKDANPS